MAKDKVPGTCLIDCCVGDAGICEICMQVTGINPKVYNTKTNECVYDSAYDPEIAQCDGFICDEQNRYCDENCPHLGGDKHD